MTQNLDFDLERALWLSAVRQRVSEVRRKRSSVGPESYNQWWRLERHKTYNKHVDNGRLRGWYWTGLLLLESGNIKRYIEFWAKADE